MDYLQKINLNDLISTGKRVFSGKNLDYLKCHDLNLSGFNFFACNIRHSSWNKCDLSAINFERIGCTDSFFSDCVLDNAMLSRGDYRRSTFENCSINGIEVRGGNFSNASFLKCKNNKWDIEGATFEKTKFINCKFENSVLRGAIFERVLFEDCILGDLDFTNLNISYANFKNCCISSININLRHLHTIRGLWETDWKDILHVQHKGNSLLSDDLDSELSILVDQLVQNKSFFNAINMKLMLHDYNGTPYLFMQAIEHCIAFNDFSMLEDIIVLYFDVIIILKKHFPVHSFEDFFNNSCKALFERALNVGNMSILSNLFRVKNLLNELKREFQEKYELGISDKKTELVLASRIDDIARDIKPEIKITIILSEHELTLQELSNYFYIFDLFWKRLIEVFRNESSNSNSLNLYSLSAGSFMFEFYTFAQKYMYLLLLFPAYMSLFMKCYYQYLQIKVQKKDLMLKNLDIEHKYIQLVKYKNEMEAYKNERLVLSEYNSFGEKDVLESIKYVQTLFPAEATELMSRIDKIMPKEKATTCFQGIKDVFMSFYGRLF